MRKNFVTGGSGFLGSHLIDALVARGEEVRALVRPTSKIDHLQNRGVELVYGDLSDVSSLEKATKGVERIYHCAALAADWGARETFYAANVTGVSNLLAASLKTNVARFIHVSTTDVYGHPDYPADESAPYRFRGWHYGDTKIQGEQRVWNYHKKYDLPITVIRPVSIYGPRSDTLVLEIVNLLKSGSMVHIGYAQKPAGLAYVTNVVDAMLLAGDSENCIGQAYNVSDGSDISWRQYVNRLAKMFGIAAPRIILPYRLAYFTGWIMEKFYGALRIKSRPLLTRMAVEIFGTHQGFPINKARRELGYEPRMDFEQGMDAVEIWLRQTGYI